MERPPSSSEEEEEEIRSWDRIGERDDVTTDEEKELGVIRRSNRGEGWWGQGPPIKASKQSVLRDFIDGAGLCSPGRWPIRRRRLPDGHLVRRFRKILFDGFLKASGKVELDGKKLGLKKLLNVLSLGHVKDQPFDKSILEEVRSDLRSALKEVGH